MGHTIWDFNAGRCPTAPLILRRQVMECDICSGINVYTTIEPEVIHYPISPNLLDMIVIYVPVTHCTECEISTTDYRAEDIREKAMQGKRVWPNYTGKFPNTPY